MVLGGSADTIYNFGARMKAVIEGKSRSNNWVAIIALCLAFVFLGNAHLLAADVTLAWDAKTETNLAGYKVYYGNASRSYSSTINVGKVTSYTVAGLGPGTYYFAVTAYYTSGTETTFSNEASKTLSSPPASGSLAHSGTLISSSQNFAGDHPVEHLWDGCTEGTSLCSSGSGSAFWVEFDLKQDYNLTSARLFGDADGDWVSTNWQLQYKRNAGDTWTTAFSNVTALFNGWSTQSLSGMARYVRVTVFGGAATQARELELFGTVPGGQPSPLPAPTNVTVL
jgi:F5/8 type C domain-containing protein/fibronectin type III domain protein